MAEKEEIRPLYSELQGYLSQAPKAEKYYEIHDSNLWQQVNNAIDELSDVSGEDNRRFKMVPEIYPESRDEHLHHDTYRGNLGGLISRLHGKYFSDEQPPFSGMPSTVIHQTQEQSQSLQVEMLLEINTQICEKLPQFEQGTP